MNGTSEETSRDLQAQPQRSSSEVPAVMSSPQSPGQQDHGSTAMTPGVACNGCRKAKLRCSRDRPACSHCIKIGHECVYEAKRTKPGVKAGAIENIQRRLDALEQRLDQDAPGISTNAAQNGITETNSGGNRAGSSAEAVLSLLATELPKLITSSKTNTRAPRASTQSPEKRRCLNGAANSNYHQYTDNHPPLLPADAVEAIVNTYFTHIHPWVPMLNQDRFRQRVQDPGELPKLEVILQSIAITVSKYLPEEVQFEDAWPVERTRTWIVMAAMDSNTIEGLQALIILAFNDVGSGNAAQAWAIIASLTRTVEFLQLTMDPEDEAVQPICRPFSYLGPAKDWADQEERRRVFWNVFLLDRFCSITMGWNTSLTSIDVHQRLPCDGILWRKQEAVLTPYLGIWDKSTGGIGNMSAASARRGSQSTLEMDHQGQTTGPYSSHRQPETDVSRIGAFAYCVEATESMSRVTTYFLQQRINPNDPEAVNSWLSRFKELDLRLVHWKMFLPQKWKPNVPKQASRMDPNLTLAHITHNASTILLHQLIAWPPPSWPFRKRLPSVWSVETCRSAGIEISTITRKYLENTPGMLPITSPFGFCVYIAARMMLVHWHHDPSNHHLEEFWSMIKSLEEMSRRWNGVARDSEVQPRDLAAKYGAKLRDMYQRCLQDDDFQINVADYAQDIDHRSLKQTEGRRCWASASMNGQTQQYPDHPESQQLWSTGNPSMTSMAPFPNMNMATHQPHGTSTVQFATVDGNQDPLGGSVSDNPADPTSICSGSFNAVEDYFMDMDRVIAFNDGSLFSAGLGDGSW